MIVTDINPSCRFEPKLINVSLNPIIIVGEKPNKTRDNSRFALCGNRTGDFVKQAIGGRSNIILTNVVNVLYSGKFDPTLYVAEGILDLITLIETYNPRKIICLGEIAKKYVGSIKDIGCEIFCMPHPSYINRFHISHRSEYIYLLRNELDK